MISLTSLALFSSTASIYTIGHAKINTCNNTIECIKCNDTLRNSCLRYCLRPTTQTTHYVAPMISLYICLVPGWSAFTAYALLEFTEAPTHILRALYRVEVGINTTASPALDVAALCLSTWPAAYFTIPHHGNASCPDHPACFIDMLSEGIGHCFDSVSMLLKCVCKRTRSLATNLSLVAMVQLL